MRVVTAAQAAARDRAAIGGGTPSIELMRRAGTRAAHVILDRLSAQAHRGTLILTGPGNNGGDGWIVAAELQRQGLPVHVEPVAPPATGDASWAAGTLPSPTTPLPEAPGIVVDALLGTGARGAPRPEMAAAIDRIDALQRDGAVIVSLDLPSGLDASTGEAERSVTADLTITFGHLKRGVLVRRDRCGEIVLVDIGLPEDDGDGAPVFVDAPWVARRVPSIGATAHKGSRRRLLIAGGSPGIAGASALAARGALRSGIGMVRFCAHPASIPALQASVPEATAVPWPLAPDAPALDLGWPHALLIGPGLGVDGGARARVAGWLQAWRGPVVVDADVFTAWAGDASSLGAALAGRPAVATPHAAEAARLLGIPLDQVLSAPWDVAPRLASQLGCAVLLKGVPTIVAAPGQGAVVVARGTPALATGGSGDVLGGIVATLLAQGVDARDAAACAAWVHGRAAELATEGRALRGVTLADVIDALPDAWRLADPPLGDHELALLPAVGERDVRA